MRAAVFTGPGSPVEVTGVELAPPGPGEVRVRIAAALRTLLIPFDPP